MSDPVSFQSGASSAVPLHSLPDGCHCRLSRATDAAGASLTSLARHYRLRRVTNASAAQETASGASGKDAMSLL